MKIATEFGLPLRVIDRAGRTLIGTLTPDGDGVRATIVVEGAADAAPLLDKRCPTLAGARRALTTSLGARAARRVTRTPKVRVRRWPDGDWGVRYVINGRRKSRKTGPEKQKAVDLARALEQRLQAIVAGVAPAPALDAPTFDKYADEVLERRWSHRVKPGTLDVYRGVVKTHLAKRFGNRRLDAITRADLKAFAYDLLRRGLKPATVRRTFAVLQIILNEAEDDELLTRNPIRGRWLGKLLKGAVTARAAEADAPDGADAEPVRCLTPDELRGLVDTAQAEWSFPFYVLLLILARTGLRIGEAVGLQWGDVDLDGHALTVRRTCRGERTSTPKSGKARRVYLTPQLADALRDLNRQRRVVALDDDQRARAWLFPDKRTGARPMHYRRLYELFVPLATRLGLRGVTPHTLRHTYASLLFAQGKTMHFVQDQLGHHDPKFTASVYGHLIPGDRRGEVDFLDGLGEPTGTRRSELT